MLSKIFAPILIVALLIARPVAAQERSETQASTPSDAAAALASAKQYDEAGQYENALASYRNLLKNFPAAPQASKAQFRIAQILEEQGNASKAFDAYQTLVSRYPDTPEFEQAVAQQVIIANQYLQGKRVVFLGLPVIPGTERAQQMYRSILNNAPYSKHAPVAQFNLGLTYERQKMLVDARSAYQTVLDKYPNSDVADDALYQIGYIYMQAGTTGDTRDLSAIVQARETFEDFLLQFPKSEKAAQARDNLVTLGQSEAGDLMTIAKYYDWARNYKAAVIYYNDVIRKQPKTPDAEYAKTRLNELRNSVGEDALRVGSERAESGEQQALRRRLQAQVETSALADYSGPSKRDIVPDELPISRAPKLRTNVRDVQPLPAVEPALPNQ